MKAPVSFSSFLPLQTFALALACTLFSGCSLFKQEKRLDLGMVYNRSAKYQGVLKRPVIVIPGIMGSRLTDTNTQTVVWGELGPGALRPGSTRANQLAALPIHPNGPYAELENGVKPTGVLEALEVNIAGFPLKLKAYQQILQVLGAGGYLDSEVHAESINYGKEHFTCFQFDYDWRLDNSANAARLHDFIVDREAYLIKEYADKYGETVDHVKFTIVAHSMGGLIARYYLRYGNQPLPHDGSPPEPTWAGVQNVEQAILIGTPNAGSAKSLGQLLGGLKLGPFGTYPSAVLASYPSLYQLLPRTRHAPFVDADGNPLDALNPTTWIENEWGLANPDQANVLATLLPDVADPKERHRIGIDHQSHCIEMANQFHQALDLPLAPPPELQLRIILGDGIPSMKTATVEDRNTVTWKDTAPGDGTVLRTSALMDERLDGNWTPRLRSPITWTSAHMHFLDHIKLTQSQEFHDNVLYMLLEAP